MVVISLAVPERKEKQQEQHDAACYLKSLIKMGAENKEREIADIRSDESENEREENATEHTLLSDQFVMVVYVNELRDIESEAP